jgi:hypothetical protein
MTHATTALLRMTNEQRSGLILARAHDILNALPAAHQALPAARELHDVLMLPISNQKDEAT